MKVDVYGVPSCGTCRKARKWLESEEVPHRFLDLREKPPSKTRVGRWVKSLGAKPLRNTSGKAYRELGPKRNDFSDREWQEAFAEEPMLIRRPVLEIDGEPVAVGFREEEWRKALLAS